LEKLGDKNIKNCLESFDEKDIVSKYKKIGIDIYFNSDFKKWLVIIFRIIFENFFFQK
jgi:hypothetical protein